MQPSENLARALARIDGADYGAYQSLRSAYRFRDFELVIEQIPKDPYAPPHTGIYRVRVPYARSGLAAGRPEGSRASVATRDFLARRFDVACRPISSDRRGTGYSGLIAVDSPSQAILERSSVVLADDAVEVRCFVGLPANGRSIDGPLAARMLLEELPRIVADSLLSDGFDTAGLRRHVEVDGDATVLRAQLDTLGLVAFVADGAILPRESGLSQAPLTASEAVAFRSPTSLRVEVRLSSGRVVTGMGIPRGVTLIVGGGYHGKSTLLQALEQGIYNHVAGDGREACVSLASTVKVRAYSGRFVVGADISPFVGTLPFGRQTNAFSTANASGSTSQAASIAEALEAGARVLLMDEDTCATNLMVRDHAMQRLVRKEDEPITTYLDRVRQLYEDNGVSSVLVLGGLGDYFAVADHVIQLRDYAPIDVTEAARAVIRSAPSLREPEAVGVVVRPQVRRPLAGSVDPRNAHGKEAVYAKQVERLNFGEQVIDLTDVEQLIDLSQTKALGQALVYAVRYMDGERSLAEVVSCVMADIEREGLDVLSERISGHLAAFPAFALAAAMSRLRGLAVAP